MYENFYRFKEKPFSLTPDPKFFFLSKQHQGALDHMLYGIKQREGFMAIVGDVGTGKTTLCRCLLDRLEKNIQVALVLNPLLSDMDLLRACVHDLRV
ncbi:MAG: AAA family ATPase, partial [Nitrospinae bacterium]|nr:AAA family ATPase [Nitrospinota bacterium]